MAKNKSEFIVVQTGPLVWCVAHTVYQPESRAFHVCYNRIPSYNLAQTIRGWLEEGKPLPAEWAKYKPNWM